MENKKENSIFFFLQFCYGPEKPKYEPYTEYTEICLLIGSYLLL